MIGIIYKYTSPSNKCYIGQTIREKIRKRSHKNAALNENVQTKFARAIRKYGWDNFTYEVLFTIDNDDKNRVKEKLDFMERYYIRKFDSYNNGYNMTEGGEGGSGKHTEEFKKRMSERMKLNNPAFHMTDEWRQHIGNASKDRKMPDNMKKLTSERMKANNPMKNPDVAKKVSQTKKGTHLLEDHKQKISKGLKGIKRSEEYKEKHRINATNRQRDSKGRFIKNNLLFK